MIEVRESESQSALLEQVCQDAVGEDYPCGRLAVQASQARVQDWEVVCMPFYAIASHRVLGIWQGSFMPSAHWRASRSR